MAASTANIFGIPQRHERQTGDGTLYTTQVSEKRLRPITFLDIAQQAANSNGLRRKEMPSWLVAGAVHFQLRRILFQQPCLHGKRQLQ